jgi:hypothetical protein
MPPRYGAVVCGAAHTERMASPTVARLWRSRAGDVTIATARAVAELGAAAAIVLLIVGAIVLLTGASGHPLVLLFVAAGCAALAGLGQLAYRVGARIRSGR